MKYLIIPVLGLALIGVVACDESDVREYTVDHQKGASAATAPAPVPVPPSVQSDAVIRWRVPPGWTRVEGNQPMRVATFKAGAAEIAVTRFPGDVGGTLANVNRWRRQLGLEPAEESDLANLITPFSRPGFDGYTLRVRGTQQHMVVGAIHDQSAGETWFVRATTTPELADQHEKDVYAFAKSFGQSEEKPK